MATLGRDYRASEPPVLVQWPTNKVSLDDKLHDAVLSGKLPKIRDLAGRGVNVDAFNEDGQTPLFCAAFKGMVEVVGVLLSLGARPNARCQPEGYTSVHGACYSGSASVLKMLIQAGGDLRICDHKRRTPIAWSLLQTDSTKVQAIRNVIESARVCTTETSGFEMLKEMQTTLSPRTSTALGDVVRNIFRKSVVAKDSRSRLGFHLNMDELNNGIHHTGFGKVFFGNGERCAGIIGLPYVSEVSELEDEIRDEAPSWQCGKFTSFNAKIWTTKKTAVSSRELFTKSGPHCVPDILINELEIRSKLHHPNLLMLLGVCQTNHCESLSLVYERVNIGSLYSVLHVDHKQLTPRFATDVVIQLCDALEYVHAMKMIHCGLSSHSVILVANGVAKLSCFEYCLPENVNSETALSVRHPILTSDAHLNVLRHWMAPEVLLRQQFSVKADVYSLSCIMWELCTLDIPWRTFTLQSMRHLYSTNPMEPLPINKNKVPHLWYHLLSLGLKPRRDSRDLDIAEIKDMMLLSKKPQVLEGPRNTYCSTQKVPTTIPVSTMPRGLEQDVDDDLDAVDLVDLGASDGRRIYPGTMAASLQEKGDFSRQYLEASPVYLKDRTDLLERVQIEREVPFGRADEEAEMNVRNADLRIPDVDKANGKDNQPQGILKKFGFNRQSKSAIGVNSQGVQTGLNFPAEELPQQCATEKETQTESGIPEKKPVESEVTEAAEILEPPKKPKRIGAILSLGMGWSKPTATVGVGASIPSSSARTCKGTQTGAPALQLKVHMPIHESSPSPVHSPTSASTPMWTSFNNSKEPIDIVVDPEIKAARHKIKEKLNKLLELRQAGDHARDFHSLRLPKKSSFVKPASHSIEAVSSHANTNANEFWNYLASTSIMSTTGERTLAPAIKPAGHAVTLHKNGRILAQKSRSHLDLPSAAAKEDVVRAGFVFDTVDRFNAVAKGKPLDFQRQRVPWDQNSSHLSRSDDGDGKFVSAVSGIHLDGQPNPFQQHTHSVAVQCSISPSRSEERNLPNIARNYRQSSSNGENSAQNEESDFSEKVSSDPEEIAAATVNSLIRNLDVGHPGDTAEDDDTDENPLEHQERYGGAPDRSYTLTTDPVNPLFDIPRIEPEHRHRHSASWVEAEDPHFMSALASPKVEGEGVTAEEPLKGSNISIREDGDRGDLSPRARSALSVQDNNNYPDSGAKVSDDGSVVVITGTTNVHSVAGGEVVVSNDK